VRQKYPFVIDAFVLLPDHFHCILTLPENDAGYAKRWRLIKLMVTKACGKELAFLLDKSPSGERRREGKGSYGSGVIGSIAFAARRS
jgi:putative transposase